MNQEKGYNSVWEAIGLSEELAAVIKAKVQVKLSVYNYISEYESLHGTTETIADMFGLDERAFVKLLSPRISGMTPEDFDHVVNSKGYQIVTSDEIKKFGKTNLKESQIILTINKNKSL